MTTPAAWHAAVHLTLRVLETMHEATRVCMMLIFLGLGASGGSAHAESRPHPKGDEDAGHWS